MITKSEELRARFLWVCQINATLLNDDKIGIEHILMSILESERSLLAKIIFSKSKKSFIDLYTSLLIAKNEELKKNVYDAKFINIEKDIRSAFISKTDDKSKMKENYPIKYSDEAYQIFEKALAQDPKVLNFPTSVEKYFVLCTSPKKEVLYKMLGVSIDEIEKEYNLKSEQVISAQAH